VGLCGQLRLLLLLLLLLLRSASCLWLPAHWCGAEQASHQSLL
jgi:hypothetical protein